MVASVDDPTRKLIALTERDMLECTHLLYKVRVLSAIIFYIEFVCTVHSSFI